MSFQSIMYTLLVACVSFFLSVSIQKLHFATAPSVSYQIQEQIPPYKNRESAPDIAPPMTPPIATTTPRKQTATDTAPYASQTDILKNISHDLDVVQNRINSLVVPPPRPPRIPQAEL